MNHEDKQFHYTDVWQIGSFIILDKAEIHSNSQILVNLTKINAILTAPFILQDLKRSQAIIEGPITPAQFKFIHNNAFFDMVMTQPLGCYWHEVALVLKNTLSDYNKNAFYHIVETLPGFLSHSIILYEQLYALWKTFNMQREIIHSFTYHQLKPTMACKWYKVTVFSQVTWTPIMPCPSLKW